jgi:HPt (histidine-containing phosphotransfer) domain-containing protein
MGDRDLRRDVLGLFLTQTPTILRQLRGLNSGDRSAIEDLAHRLKGSARAIGAIRMACAAEACETSVSRAGGNFGLALEELTAAFAEAATAIERMLAEE